MAAIIEAKQKEEIKHILFFGLTKDGHRYGQDMVKILPLGPHLDFPKEWAWASFTEALTYNNWDDGEPNNIGNGQGCAQLRKDNKWDDTDCGNGMAI